MTSRPVRYVVAVMPWVLAAMLLHSAGFNVWQVVSLIVACALVASQLIDLGGHQ